MQEHNFLYYFTLSRLQGFNREHSLEHSTISRPLLWLNDCWPGLASYQALCCTAANPSVEGRRSQGTWMAALAASHLWRDKRCPQNDPIPVSCGSTTARA